MIEHYIELILDNSIVSTLLLFMIISLLIIFSLLVSGFKNKYFGIKTRRIQSRLAERSLVKTAVVLLLISSIGLLASVLMASTNAIEKSSINDWRGKWGVSLEETGCFRYSEPNNYELVIDFDKGKILGILYDQQQKRIAKLSSINIKNDYHMSGKIGYLDGRKMKFEFTMEYEREDFIGKYKLRHGVDEWKSWRGRKLQ